MYNIRKDIENEIIDAINIILDEYLQGRTSGTKHAKNVIDLKDYDEYFNGVVKTIYDAKRDFNKNSSISQLIKDINYAGYQNFININSFDGDTLNEKEYRILVIKLLNDVIKDRIALEKDKQSIMENTKNFEQFFESKNIKI